jgi:hypothetical protein
MLYSEKMKGAEDALNKTKNRRGLMIKSPMRSRPSRVRESGVSILPDFSRHGLKSLLKHLDSLLLERALKPAGLAHSRLSLLLEGHDLNLGRVHAANHLLHLGVRRCQSPLQLGDAALERLDLLRQAAGAAVQG